MSNYLSSLVSGTVSAVGSTLHTVVSLTEINPSTLSGAIDIAGIGDQFLEKINGSYSAVLGLPMCKVRQSLFKLGFYE